MKIGIVGSRGFNNYKLLCEVLSGLNATEIISGGAKGADLLGRMYAQDNKLPLTEFLPNWDLYGRSAGFIRNNDIIKNSDIVIAFWDRKSKGTKSSIDISIKLGKPLRIIDYVSSKYKDHNEFEKFI